MEDHLEQNIISELRLTLEKLNKIWDEIGFDHDHKKNNYHHISNNIRVC